MTTYQREPAQTLWSEILPLLHEHKEEIAHYPDILLDPDVDGYNFAEYAGLLRCYTARVNDGLVGYGIFIVRWNMHYRQSLQAVQDVLFVTKPHRYGRIGLGLIRFSERELTAEGVQVVYHHLKVSTPQTIALFHKLGYEDIDLIVGKRLDGPQMDTPNF